jgi:hypothetical protein
VPQASGPVTRPAVPAPSTGGGSIESSAGTLSGEAAAGNAPADTFDDGNSARDAADRDNGSGGTDWLRVAEIIVAIAFFASALYVFVPGLIKKGN